MKTITPKRRTQIAIVLIKKAAVEGKFCGLSANKLIGALRERIKQPASKKIRITNEELRAFATVLLRDSIMAVKREVNKVHAIR